MLPLHHTFEFTCGLLLPLSRGARILYLDELNAERLAEGLPARADHRRWSACPRSGSSWSGASSRASRSRARPRRWPSTGRSSCNRLLGKRLGVNAGRLFFGSVHDALGGNTRFLISGGAALPKDTAELFAGLGLPLAEGYGLTEAAPVLTVARASVKAKPGNVGIAGAQAWSSGSTSPDERGVGEVLARGPNVMVGYAGNAEATAQAIDADGLAAHRRSRQARRARSALVIVGRQKDVIVSASGENVYPDDVETLLGKLDGVKELAIVGIDDGKGGERVACLAVPEGEPSADVSFDGFPPPPAPSATSAR